MTRRGTQSGETRRSGDEAVAARKSSRFPRSKCCLTVAALIRHLKRIPGDTEIRQGFGEGCFVVVYNQGNPDKFGPEHLSFEDPSDYDLDDDGFEVEE